MPSGPSPISGTFGRGAAGAKPNILRFGLARQRPGTIEWSPPLENPFVSRDQLELRIEGDHLEVVNKGRCPLLVEGESMSSASVAEGMLLELKDQLLLLCVRRPFEMRSLRDATIGSSHSFGLADAQGLVGESVATWELRERLAFVARRDAHVLLLGASGTGKELAAQAIHALSRRSRGPIVSRNAATLPPGIADAELFGNARNYPNAGMPERPGLVGEASGGTLFLDEIGELPAEVQTHLLRVLDQGEYQRLGETGRKRSDFRLLGATNRSPEHLRPDLAARLPLRVDLPSLNERKEDVPLLAMHLLHRLAARDPELRTRFFDCSKSTEGVPRMTLRLVDQLMQLDYQTNVRELETILWAAMSSSTGSEITCAPQQRSRPLSSPPSVPAREVSAEEVRAALEACGGKREAAWRKLGLPNRYVLKRLMQKYEIK